MSDLEQTKIPVVDVLQPADSTAAIADLSIRVSSQSYVAAIFLGTFITALLLYCQYDLAGVLVFGISWIFIPYFALNDKIIFNGSVIARNGHLPRFWSWLNSSRRRLKIGDIEQVETQAIRVLKRGGAVRYRYLTGLKGKGIKISIVSGSGEFREMIRSILSRLPDNVLDDRSKELCTHLTDPKEVVMKAEFSRIPSSDVLEASYRSSVGKPGSLKVLSTGDFDKDIFGEKADELRNLGNELRVSGYLVRSLEVFRRALVLRPEDAGLLFDFASCMHSLAGVERDHRLERRALAAFRLSEKRAEKDSEILSRLGAFYFQIGEWRRAGQVFHKVLEDFGENFRTSIGLAELALREGKIAHVIHHFSTAQRLAETSSLRRWTRTETEYFSNLQSDEEYMELEIGRVNMLETIDTTRRSTLRIAMFGFPLIAVGVVFDDTFVANIGWAVSAMSLLIWAISLVAGRLLDRRMPYDLIGNDN